MEARFTVEFRGTVPGEVRVGDTLGISGRVTVHKIEGELVDITAIGARNEVALGELTVGLYANDLACQQIGPGTTT